jgi:hypothetical protein
MAPSSSSAPLAVSFLALLVAGCGSDRSTGTLDLDAGAAREGGAVGADAGTGQDAAAGNDGSAAREGSATDLDGGSVLDAGTVDDGGSTHDGGIVNDGGSTDADSGPAQDGGVRNDGGAECIAGCTRGTIRCASPDPPVEWGCVAPGINSGPRFVDAGCTSVPIGSVAWCCPSTFLSQCP